MTAPIPIHQPPFRHLGDQLLSVARAETGRVDPRLLAVRSAAAGASEQVPSDGGFLVAPEFSRTIIKRAYDVGKILSRCTQLPTSGSEYKFPQFNETSRATGSRLGGVQVFPESEAAALIPTKPNFQQGTAAIRKITGLLYLSDELAMDSDAWNAWANYAFALELAFCLENLIVTGSGAGEPLGVTKAPALITIAKESGQVAATVVSANIEKMLAQLWAPSHETAIWLYNQALLQQLLGLTTVVGAAGSQSNLFQFRSSDDGSNRIAGLPAFPSEYCAAPGTPGDLLLCDFSRYLVVSRSIQQDVSMHVLFLTDQRAFRFILRCDGQPIDNAAVTPLNGTNPTSPFVALAQR